MKETVLTITENSMIAKNIYRMKLSLLEDVGEINCGQFLALSLGVPDMPLRRPFGICDYDSGSVTVCYQVVGKGTCYMAKMQIGTQLKAVLPLGNGFDLTNAKRVALVGGGVGIFPLLSVMTAHPNKEYFSCLGFRSKDFICLEEEFSKKSKLSVCTDDGSNGQRCNAVDLLFDLLEKENIDTVLSCGPTPMLRALKNRLEARGKSINCQLSLEERMGCGIGACLVCTCKINRAGGTERLRICKDGPVFDASEVDFE